MFKMMEKEQYEELLEGAQIYEKQGGLEKVFRTSTEQVVKLFDARSGLKKLRRGRAEIFDINARKLESLGIRTVLMRGLYHLPHQNRDMVVYDFLPGDVLQDYFKTLKLKEAQEIFLKLAKFLAELHDKGVYFRSLHLGNVLWRNGEFALIDINDMQISKKPLNRMERVRNFRALTRRKQDLKTFAVLGLYSFWKVYLEAAGLDEQRMTRFLTLQEHKNPFAFAILKKGNFD